MLRKIVLELGPMDPALDNIDKIYDTGDGNLCWIYHNSDADSGDQMVVSIFSKEQAAKALKYTKANLYDLSCEIPMKVYLFDAGMLGYVQYRQMFENIVPEIEGTVKNVKSTTRQLKAYLEV